MTIVVKSRQLKIYHARSGLHNIFGQDVDQRKKMDEAQAIERFDRVWTDSLSSAVEDAPLCQPEHARSLLDEKQRNFFNEDQEHREFRLQGGSFLAQLDQVDKNTQELTQLWFICSSNVDPRTVFVTFDTIELRENFRQVAAKLAYPEEELGKKLFMDFMETVQRIA